MVAAAPAARPRPRAAPAGHEPGDGALRASGTPLAVHFTFADRGAARQWWLVCCRTHTTVVRQRPAIAVVLHIQCTTAALTDVWLGHLSWLQAVRDQVVRFVGDREAAHAVLGWLGTSRFATVSRAEDNADSLADPRHVPVAPLS